MAITVIPPPSESDLSLISEQPQPQQQHPATGTTAPAHPPHALHQHSLSNASTASVDIEAWTAAALESLSIAPIARGTGNPLSIPLDSDASGTPKLKLRNVVGFDKDGTYGGTSIAPPRGAPGAPPTMRRDSMKRREALLKGNEGSRQRRRWENDHLVHVPNVQPPQPCDWQVRPTYPVHGTVPYELAKYWDKGLRERVDERRAAFTSRRKVNTTEPAAAADVGKVTRELRATAKRTPAVKSWLRTLEEPVRQFLVDRGLVAAAAPTAAAAPADDEALAASVATMKSDFETDTEDEEIVFVGRNGMSMRDGKPPPKKQQQAKEEVVEEEEDDVVVVTPEKKPRAPAPAAEPGMVMDTLGDDESGPFKRWLTHSISDYYGLDSKSVMMGNPARRVVYVGVKLHRASTSSSAASHPVRHALPPPLWEMF
ncbi:R3H-associated N-terminal domain-containing protein [Podospora didyma]|uniref:R3H-associated N-terminal domain-containing protein n=1 Tax=Podospora didyma TaxID=330526 RepID=A0AAE0NXN2_9PEZI|nr:R3H-associated N-terminal domain-containing protein [Podospora didyma]